MYDPCLQSAHRHAPLTSLNDKLYGNDFLPRWVVIGDQMLLGYDPFSVLFWFTGIIFDPGFVSAHPCTCCVEISRGWRKECERARMLFSLSSVLTALSYWSYLVNLEAIFFIVVHQVSLFPLHSTPLVDLYRKLRETSIRSNYDRRERVVCATRIPANGVKLMIMRWIQTGRNKLILSQANLIERLQQWIHSGGINLRMVVGVSVSSHHNADWCRTSKKNY